MTPATVYTLGHSDRPGEELFALLAAHGIRRLADVRRYPGSRRHPQFSGPTLAETAGRVEVTYRHFPELGGYRGDGAGSRHRAWKEEGFRAYATHMESRSFLEALERLLEWAADSPAAVMCAEASPWHCHRQLLSDALLVRGVDVVHILGAGRTEPHRLPAFARREGTTLVYDGGLLELDLG